jgi:succinate-semialdehyde dehydrogenase/glutarate-semialdehyde dehydrogenase
MTLKSINPYTNRLIEESEEFSSEYISELISRSSEAFKTWKKTQFNDRNTLMKKLSGLLRNNTKLYAGTITEEMGKPFMESVSEIEKCAWVCDYFSEHAGIFLRHDKIATDASESYIVYDPIGTVLGIMPWNFPFWQVFRFAVPTLMAGNTVLLKHASNVQICARHIEKLFSDAGFPDNIFLNLATGSDKIAKVIENDSVKAVSLTGSELAGQKVAEIAGRKIKKTVLELGGSNAFIVLEDADIEKAVETGIHARMQNAGQSCIAAKRFIVDKKISEEFITLFSKKVKNLKYGDPLKQETAIGPLCSIEQAKTVEKQVRTSIEMGAQLITGGYPDNALYPPTLLSDVRPGMPVFDEEVFGPVAPVITARNTEEAVSLANQSRFGLGVNLFTSNIAMAKELAHEFDDGAVFINSMVKSDPRLPFGGTKNSGYGRELAVQGIREFVNVKTVYVA